MQGISSLSALAAQSFGTAGVDLNSLSDGLSSLASAAASQSLPSFDGRKRTSLLDTSSSSSNSSPPSRAIGRARTPTLLSNDAVDSRIFASAWKLSAERDPGLLFAMRGMLAPPRQQQKGAVSSAGREEVPSIGSYLHEAKARAAAREAARGAALKLLVASLDAISLGPSDTNSTSSGESAAAAPVDDAPAVSDAAATADGTNHGFQSLSVGDSRGILERATRALACRPALTEPSYDAVDSVLSLFAVALAPWDHRRESPPISLRSDAPRQRRKQVSRPLSSGPPSVSGLLLTAWTLLSDAWAGGRAHASDGQRLRGMFGSVAVLRGAMPALHALAALLRGLPVVIESGDPLFDADTVAAAPAGSAAASGDAHFDSNDYSYTASVLSDVVAASLQAVHSAEQLKQRTATADGSLPSYALREIDRTARAVAKTAASAADSASVGEEPVSELAALARSLARDLVEHAPFLSPPAASPPAPAGSSSSAFARVPSSTVRDGDTQGSCMDEESPTTAAAAAATAAADSAEAATSSCSPTATAAAGASLSFPAPPTDALVGHGGAAVAIALLTLLSEHATAYLRAHCVPDDEKETPLDAALVAKPLPSSQRGASYPAQSTASVSGGDSVSASASVAATAPAMVVSSPEEPCDIDSTLPPPPQLSGETTSSDDAPPRASSSSDRAKFAAVDAACAFSGKAESSSGPSPATSSIPHIGGPASQYSGGGGASGGTGRAASSTSTHYITPQPSVITLLFLRAFASLFAEQLTGQWDEGYPTAGNAPTAAHFSAAEVARIRCSSAAGAGLAAAGLSAVLNVLRAHLHALDHRGMHTDWRISTSETCVSKGGSAVASSSSVAPTQSSSGRPRMLGAPGNGWRVLGASTVSTADAGGSSSGTVAAAPAPALDPMSQAEAPARSPGDAGSDGDHFAATAASDRQKQRMVHEQVLRGLTRVQDLVERQRLPKQQQRVAPQSDVAIVGPLYAGVGTTADAWSGPLSFLSSFPPSTTAAAVAGAAPPPLVAAAAAAAIATTTSSIARSVSLGFGTVALHPQAGVSAPQLQPQQQQRPIADDPRALLFDPPSEFIFSQYWNAAERAERALISAAAAAAADITASPALFSLTAYTPLHQGAPAPHTAAGPSQQQQQLQQHLQQSLLLQHLQQGPAPSPAVRAVLRHPRVSASPPPLDIGVAAAPSTTGDASPAPVSTSPMDEDEAVLTTAPGSPPQLTLTQPDAAAAPGSAAATELTGAANIQQIPLGLSAGFAPDSGRWVASAVLGSTSLLLGSLGASLARMLDDLAQGGGTTALPALPQEFLILIAEAPKSDISASSFARRDENSARAPAAVDVRDTSAEAAAQPVAPFETAAAAERAKGATTATSAGIGGGAFGSSSSSASSGAGGSSSALQPPPVEEEREWMSKLRRTIATSTSSSSSSSADRVGPQNRDGGSCSRPQQQSGASGDIGDPAMRLPHDHSHHRAASPLDVPRHHHASASRSSYDDRGRASVESGHVIADEVDEMMRFEGEGDAAPEVVEVDSPHVVEVGLFDDAVEVAPSPPKQSSSRGVTSTSSAEVETTAPPVAAITLPATPSPHALRLVERSNALSCALARMLPSLLRSVSSTWAASLPLAYGPVPMAVHQLALHTLTAAADSIVAATETTCPVVAATDTSARAPANALPTAASTFSPSSSSSAGAAEAGGPRPEEKEAALPSPPSRPLSDGEYHRKFLRLQAEGVCSSLLSFPEYAPHALICEKPLGHSAPNGVQTFGEVLSAYSHGATEVLRDEDDAILAALVRLCEHDTSTAAAAASALSSPTARPAASPFYDALDALQTFLLQPWMRAERPDPTVSASDAAAFATAAMSLGAPLPPSSATAARAVQGAAALSSSSSQPLQLQRLITGERSSGGAFSTGHTPSPSSSLSSASSGRDTHGECRIVPSRVGQPHLVSGLVDAAMLRLRAQGNDADAPSRSPAATAGRSTGDGVARLSGVRLQPPLSPPVAPMYLFLLPSGLPVPPPPAPTPPIHFDSARCAESIQVGNGGGSARAGPLDRTWGSVLGDSGMRRGSGVYAWDISLPRIARGNLFVGLASRGMVMGMASHIGSDAHSWGLLGSGTMALWHNKQRIKSSYGPAAPLRQGMVVRIVVDSDSDTVHFMWGRAPAAVSSASSSSSASSALVKPASPPALCSVAGSSMFLRDRNADILLFDPRATGYALPTPPAVSAAAGGASDAASSSSEAVASVGVYSPLYGMLRGTQSVLQQHFNLPAGDSAHATTSSSYEYMTSTSYARSSAPDSASAAAGSTASGGSAAGAAASSNTAITSATAAAAGGAGNLLPNVSWGVAFKNVFRDTARLRQGAANAGGAASTPLELFPAVSLYNKDDEVRIALVPASEMPAVVAALSSAAAAAGAAGTAAEPSKAAPAASWDIFALAPPKKAWFSHFPNVGFQGGLPLRLQRGFLGNPESPLVWSGGDAQQQK